MRLLARLLVAVLIFLRVRRRPALPPPPPPDPERALPEYVVRPRDVTLVALLLLASGAFAAAFVVVYLVDANTQLLGLSAGLAAAALAAALVLAGFRLSPQELVEERRETPVDPEAQAEAEQILDESAQRLPRRRLLLGAGAAAGTLAGAAALVPLASLGARVGSSLDETPWRRGRRLVREDGRPIRADEIDVGGFVTAFPEGADPRELGSPVVLLRIREDELRLPADRRGWAPGGLMAFSRICTHAGCAISLFRYPLYAPASPGPALVCPCHYSTFDVTRAAEVTFGPAARPLPQLPLVVDADGHVLAGGGFSGKIGPSWWGVRQ